MSGSIASRRLEPEILDTLEPADPRAMRARRDLRRVNWMMGSCGTLLRALGGPSAHALHPWRLLELGAGDGRLLLCLARALARRSGNRAPQTSAAPRVCLWLLDRQTLLEPATREAYRSLGWQVEPLTMDVQTWLALAPERADQYDAILVNLFLHHLDEPTLRGLFAMVARRCDRFVACEPRRAALALLGSRLLGCIGASALTRHDGLASVRAGFRDEELSALWPAGPWRLQERAAGAFAHVFTAERIARGVRTADSLQ
jgi:hypothetical protein